MGPPPAAVVTSYLDTFPFPYYILLRDIESLPRTLANLLRQVSSGGAWVENFWALVVQSEGALMSSAVVKLNIGRYVKCINVKCGLVFWCPTSFFQFIFISNVFLPCCRGWLMDWCVVLQWFELMQRLATY